jgi:hypothetical protein
VRLRVTIVWGISMPIRAHADHGKAVAHRPAHQRGHRGHRRRPNVTEIATAGDSVWTAAATTGVLQRISPRTETIVHAVRLGKPLGGIAADHERIWITVR